MNSIIAILKVIQSHIRSYHVFAKLNSDFNISGSKSPLFFGEFWCQTDSTNSVRELARGQASETCGREPGLEPFLGLECGISWDIMGYNHRFHSVIN